MKKATFFFRSGGVIVTQIGDEHSGCNIGQRLCAGGFIVGQDSFWGKMREAPINLGDVSCVIVEEITTPDSEQAK